MDAKSRAGILQHCKILLEKDNGEKCGIVDTCCVYTNNNPDTETAL